MPLFGNIVVIKRNGTDGITFPLTASSCLFGRRTECDIRIQLPQVSKEHCKIEVNENKEAILTNLSSVNPTKLNGGCFQQPVPLKHGDVLTIIDRSFRFEYPLQSTPRKRRSRSPKDETLQVLHVQQVTEVELLHKQTSGSASDNAECEEKNATESKQNTEENISKALPVKLQTPKSSHRSLQSSKIKYEMSPFSQLYENLKQEIKVKKPSHQGNVSQQATKGNGNSVLEPSAVTPCSICDLGSLAEEKERGQAENVEECKITMRQDVIITELNQILAVGSATKKRFTRTPRTSVSRGIGQGSQELSTTGESKGTEVTATPLKHIVGNAGFPLTLCPIVVMDYLDQSNTGCSEAAAGQAARATETRNASKGDKSVVSTPTPRRRGPQSPFVSPKRTPHGMAPGNTETPKTGRRVSFKRCSFSQALAESQDAACRKDGLEQLPLAETKSLKQRRSSKQPTPGTQVKGDVLKEICDQANFNSEEGQALTPASKSKSPRRNSRQNKELSNKSVLSETLASEELTSPASQTSGSGRKRGSPRSSGLLTEKALGTDVISEQDDTGLESKDTGTKEEVATKESQNQELEDTGATRPRRLSSKRRSGSSTELKDKGAGSEMNIAGLLAGEESGKKKRICQKRKSADVLLQPLGKRKRVSFGGQLSPELFDKSLPPNSPLKRGAIPARLSLSIGNSPRAVLKKAQGLKHFAVQELCEHLQKETMSPQNAPTQKSPAASSPVSGKATPTFDLFSPEPPVRGRFSVSHIPTPSPIAEEKDAVGEDMNTGNKNGAQVRTPESSHVNPDDKTHPVATPEKLSRSAQFALKVTPKKRRSGAVAVIHAKRRSGASSANLLVAKSWAEVVKSGVARPQSKAAKRKIQKGRSLKKRTQAPKTPERKIKGHFSTGHAESPDTIIVGRAYSTTVRTAGRVPRVVKNPVLNLNMNMDESFTGMTEMFQTPENKSGNTSPVATVQKTDFTPTCTAVEISELQTPEECGEMMVSPLNSSADSEQKQDSPGINHLLREEESLEPMLEAIATKTPVRRKTMLEENSMECSSTIPEKQSASQVKSGSKRRTPRQKLEPVEALSGIRQLVRTPRQKAKPVEALSGIKQLLRTPKQKLEPVEVLSGIKQLLRTPKQKMEPVEVLSGIKQLLRTPKQKLEPVEVLSGIKQLLRTPRKKPEPVEALSGIKQLMKTPKQKPEPVEDLSGIKQLLRTPKQKPEPVEDLSGIKQLLRTPKQELEAVTDEIAFKRLLKTPVQKKAAPKVKHPPVEDMVGLSRIFKSPKERAEGREDLCGISRLLSTPREKNQPLDDFVGLQRLMAEPRQKPSGFEVDYAGVTEMFDTPQEAKVRSGPLMDSKEEDTAAPSTNFNKEKGKNILEDKNISQGEDSSQKKATSEEQSTQRPTRSRARKAMHPTSAKECEKDLNLRELQDLEKKSTQEEEEVGETRTSPLAAKNKGRGRRRNCCIQEEIVSEHPDQEKVETVSVCGDTQRSGRGRRKEPKELKHPSENLEFCGQDSSVLQKEAAAVEQTLQECGINDMLETEDDPTTKSVSAPGRNADENCQLQTGVKNPEKKPHEGGLEDSEAMLLSPGKRPKGGKKVEKTEPLIAARRGRRARSDQVKEASSEELQGPTRKLRKDTLAKMEQREEQTCDKDAETAAAEAAENGPKLGIEVAEKRVQSLRSSRKHLTEGKADICEVALENTQNMQKTEETSPETVTETQSCIKNEIKVSQGDETENAQENATEASPKFKAESPSGVTNKTLESALNLETNRGAVQETNRGAVQETNRTRKRRGRKDSLEKKTDVLAGDVNNPELISPQIKSDTEMGDSSFKGSLGSVCTKDMNEVRQEENSPGGTAVPAASSDSLAQNHQKRTRNKQGTVKPQPAEILQENQAHTNGAACRRGRGKKVNFELEEANSKGVGGKGALPGDGKGMTYRDGECEAVENPSSQVRRSRRKQTDSMAQIACSTLMEKQTLSEDQSKDEAFVKEQDSALEAAPSSTGDRTLRRGKSREVAAASQTSRALSTRKGRGLLEGDDKTVAVREDQNSAMGNRSLQAKANASARDKRKKIDLAAEAKSSSSLQRKSSLTEAEDKEENTKEEQNMPLETVSCAKEKPLGRGRRKETALASQTTNYIPLRGKRGLATNNGREEAPKEDQNVPLGTFDSSVKENQLRKGRRKGITLLSDATTSTWRNQGLSKGRGRKNNGGEAKNLILHNSTLQEKMDLPKRNLRQTVTSLAAGSTSLQDSPEDGKHETPEEQQAIVLEAAPSAKENPSRVGRKKTISSRSEETSSTALRKEPALPKNRAQKRILKEGEDTSLENDSPQLQTRQLRNKRKKVEFMLEAAPSTSITNKNSNLPGNSSTSETQSESLTSTGLEKNHQSGKGKEVTPVQQETSTARRRKAQLPADGLASKKLRSESEDNRSLPKGKRSKTKAELKEEDARATQSAGGTDRKTRSSSRTSARTRK